MSKKNGTKYWTNKQPKAVTKWFEKKFSPYRYGLTYFYFYKNKRKVYGAQVFENNKLLAIVNYKNKY